MAFEKKGKQGEKPIAIYREVIKFKIVNGPLAGQIIARKCRMRSRNTFPKNLMPGNPTPFRLGKKIAEDFYEIEQTGFV